MKTKLFVILILFLLSLSSFSQYYLWVSVTNERLEPSIHKNGMSDDDTLNQIFRDFEVIEYFQSFPGAKTPGLQNFYEIHVSENRNKNIDSITLSYLQAKREVYDYPDFFSHLTKINH